MKTYSCEWCGDDFESIPSLHVEVRLEESSVSGKEGLKMVSFQNIEIYLEKTGRRPVNLCWRCFVRALRAATQALHTDPEKGYTCDIVGCMEEDVAGWHWGGLYLRLCSRHLQGWNCSKPLPLIKQWRLDREASRDPVTGELATGPLH